MKKILYIHGLGGGENGRVSTILRKELSSEFIIDAPEIPINPKEAVDFIKSITFNSDYDLIVASSLGAFYAMFTPSHIKKILINPAIYADEYIKYFIGEGIYRFNSSRKDGTTEYVIDNKFIDSLKALRDSLYLDDENFIMFRCYVSKEDELLKDNYKNCENFFFNNSITYIKGPHRVDEKELKDKIIRDIKIDEKIKANPWIIYGIDGRINI